MGPVGSKNGHTGSKLIPIPLRRSVVTVVVHSYKHTAHIIAEDRLQQILHFPSPIIDVVTTSVRKSRARLLVLTKDGALWTHEFSERNERSGKQKKKSRSAVEQKRSDGDNDDGELSADEDIILGGEAVHMATSTVDAQSARTKHITANLNQDSGSSGDENNSEKRKKKKHSTNVTSNVNVLSSVRSIAAPNGGYGTTGCDIIRFTDHEHRVGRIDMDNVIQLSSFSKFTLSDYNDGGEVEDVVDEVLAMTPSDEYATISLSRKQGVTRATVEQIYTFGNGFEKAESQRTPTCMLVVDALSSTYRSRNCNMDIDLFKALFSVDDALMAQVMCLVGYGSGKVQYFSIQGAHVGQDKKGTHRDVFNIQESVLKLVPFSVPVVNDISKDSNTLANGLAVVGRDGCVHIVAKQQRLRSTQDRVKDGIDPIDEDSFITQRSLHLRTRLIDCVSCHGRLLFLTASGSVLSMELFSRDITQDHDATLSIATHQSGSLTLLLPKPNLRELPIQKNAVALCAKNARHQTDQIRVLMGKSGCLLTLNVLDHASLDTLTSNNIRIQTMQIGIRSALHDIDATQTSITLGEQQIEVCVNMYFGLSFSVSLSFTYLVHLLSLYRY